MLYSQNINLPNVNQKLKLRWLQLFPITQVNYQRNDHNLDLRCDAELCHIYKFFHIGLLKPYGQNDQDGFAQPHHTETVPEKDVSYDIEKAVNFRFSHPAREPLYQIRWKCYLSGQDQWIHSDEIAVEVKFGFWQAEHVKLTFPTRGCHRGPPEPRKRSEIPSEMQAESDRVIQSIMRTSVVWFEEHLTDKLFNLFIKG